MNNTTTTFSKVWYLPKENSIKEMNMLAMRDSGKLFIADNSIEYKGKKGNVRINEIDSVEYGKQGRDFVNNWVKIKYRNGKVAFFADGSFLGWGGMLGGTKKIYQSVQSLTEGS